MYDLLVICILCIIKVELTKIRQLKKLTILKTCGLNFYYVDVFVTFKSVLKLCKL